MSDETTSKTWKLYPQRGLVLEPALGRLAELLERCVVVGVNFPEFDGGDAEIRLKIRLKP